MKTADGEILLQQTVHRDIWLTVMRPEHSVTLRLTPAQVLRLAGQLQRLSWRLAKTQNSR